MPISIARQPHFLQGILLAAYVGSFLFPALYYGKDQSGKDKELFGFQVLADGFQRIPQLISRRVGEEDKGKASLHLAGGLANPLMWVALYFFFRQRWLPACLFGAVAFIFGLYAVGLLFKGTITDRLGLGAYLWLSSMLALTIMASLNWRCTLKGINP